MKFPAATMLQMTVTFPIKAIIKLKYITFGTDNKKQMNNDNAEKILELKQEVNLHIFIMGSAAY
jgi:hypothetical protein